jgi:hypothetical protein
MKSQTIKTNFGKLINIHYENYKLFKEIYVSDAYEDVLDEIGEPIDSIAETQEEFMTIWFSLRELDKRIKALL